MKPIYICVDRKLSYICSVATRITEIVPVVSPVE